MRHRRHRGKAPNALSPEELASARKEATHQIRQRDELGCRAHRLRDLEQLEQWLADRNHPAWWAIAFAVLPWVPSLGDVGLWSAVQTTIGQLSGRMQDAISSARGLTALPIVLAKKSAEKGETLQEATERILLERGASSYSIVRALDAYSATSHSAGLPQSSTRRVRRRAKSLREAAERKHEALAAVAVPRPVPNEESMRSEIVGGILEWFEKRKRTAEQEQAAILANLRTKKPQGPK